MDALDRRGAHRVAGPSSDFPHQGATVPIDRPAPPEPELAGDEDADDLVAVAEAHQLPDEVPGRAEFRCVDVDQQEVGFLAGFDATGDAADPGGVRPGARRVVEP